MRVGVLALLALLTPAVARAQADTPTDGEATTPQAQQSQGPVRNKTTAERISSPNPTSEGVPWSFPVFWDQSLTINTFNEASQLSPSPNYTWWFSAAPRWIFNEVHSIGAAASVSIEWTDSPGVEFERQGFYSREALWSDVRLDYLLSVPGKPGGFLFFVAADLRLPSSKFSRTRDRYFSPGIRATVIRPFSVLAGMQLGVTAAFWGWFAGSNVALGSDDIPPCRIAPSPGAGGLETDSCFGPTSAVKHTTRLTVFWTLVPVDRLAIALGYSAFWARGFDLATGCVDTLTGPVCVSDGSANDHWRTFGNFRATIGYDIRRWFTLALSYDVWSVQPNADGTRENPFYNENSRLLFTLTFRADGLYASTKEKRATASLRTGVEEL